MSSATDFAQLCRLCLVKEQVNVDIFEEPDNIRQIFHKISTCLPVKLSKEDKLPKRICEGCLYKLNIAYQFWNTSVNAEKQLLQWLKQSTRKSEADFPEKVKEEIDVPGNEIENIEDFLETSLTDVNTGKSETCVENVPESSDDEPLAKRRRRLRAQTRAAPPKPAEVIVGKVELNETDGDDNSDDPDDPNYLPDGVDMSDDNEQPGPSGLGTSTSDIPKTNRLLKLNGVLCKNKKKDNKSIDVFDHFLSGELKESADDEDEENLKGKFVVPKGYVNPFVYRRRKRKYQPSKARAETSKWVCVICSKDEKDKRTLIEHYEYHKMERDAKLIPPDDSEVSALGYYHCNICFQEFTSAKAYKKHFDRKHGDRKFTCFVCEKFYKDAFQLAVHNFLMHQSGDHNFQCVLCEYKTDNRKDLKEHVQKHEENFKYKCSVCGKGFDNQAAYEEHESIHNNTAHLVCEICGEAFPNSKSLLKHKRGNHPEVLGQSIVGNECYICGKNFADKKSLILHIRGHTGESSVLCDMCGKRLSSAEHLKLHLRIHTGYKPYTCTVCGKGFAKKCTLTLHERVHSGEKPYVCKICTKAFSQRSTLVIHERYHTGERPYVCNLCSKGFVAKGLLSVHVKSCNAIPSQYLN